MFARTVKWWVFFGSSYSHFEPGVGHGKNVPRPSKSLPKKSDTIGKSARSLRISGIVSDIVEALGIVVLKPPKRVQKESLA